MSQESIKKVIEAHKSSIMKIPGVVGIGEGRHNDLPCIVILVTSKESPHIKRIPETINGYKVKIEETGEFRAFTEENRST